MKVCTKCGAGKPATTEHWHLDSSKRDGLYSSCRECRKKPRKGRPRASLEDRFWPKVDKRGPNECWEWQSNLAPDGYGQLFTFGEDGKRHSQVRAHRASYQIHRGPIPTGLFVCHSCDNRLCVNPAHLFLGTPKQNTRDMVRKRRHRYGDNHPCSKLTSEEVHEIKRLTRQTGLPQTEIARRFGVHQGTVNAILRGRRWKHL